MEDALAIMQGLQHLELEADDDEGVSPDCGGNRVDDVVVVGHDKITRDVGPEKGGASPSSGTSKPSSVSGGGCSMQGHAAPAIAATVLPDNPSMMMPRRRRGYLCLTSTAKRQFT